MARPIKKGLDYFSFDVDFFEDPKIRKLNRNYGAEGLTIYLYLITAAYKEEGYYLIYDEDIEINIVEDLHINGSKVKEIVNYILDIDLLIKIDVVSGIKILTSTRIQKNYSAGIKERARKNKINVKRDIWLLNDTQENINII